MVEVSEENKGKIIKISGARNRKLSTSKKAWITRRDGRIRRTLCWENAPPRMVPAPDCCVASKRIIHFSFQVWSDTDSRRTDLEQRALRIGAAHQPVRRQNPHKADDGLECACGRSHADIA